MTPEPIRAALDDAVAAETHRAALLGATAAALGLVVFIGQAVLGVFGAVSMPPGLPTGLAFGYLWGGLVAVLLRAARRPADRPAGRMRFTWSGAGAAFARCPLVGLIHLGARDVLGMAPAAAGILAVAVVLGPLILAFIFDEIVHRAINIHLMGR